MRVVVPRWGLKRILQWTQRVLVAGAVSLLGYCGFVVMDAWIFQHAERRKLDRQLQSRQIARPDHLNASPVFDMEPSKTVTEGTIGHLRVARLGLSVIVIEGISKATLRRAAGHIPGTVLPGEAGNIGIAGHRDTFFRGLRNIRQDDIITLDTPLGEYGYRVVSTRVVSPFDVDVLDSTGDQTLTLVTCYPFYFLGSAPDRFVVRAERVP